MRFCKNLAATGALQRDGGSSGSPQSAHGTATAMGPSARLLQLDLPVPGQLGHSHCHRAGPPSQNSVRSLCSAEQVSAQERSVSPLCCIALPWSPLPVSDLAVLSLQWVPSNRCFMCHHLTLQADTRGAAARGNEWWEEHVCTLWPANQDTGMSGREDLYYLSCLVADFLFHQKTPTFPLVQSRALPEGLCLGGVQMLPHDLFSISFPTHSVWKHTFSQQSPFQCFKPSQAVWLFFMTGVKMLDPQQKTSCDEEALMANNEPDFRGNLHCSRPWTGHRFYSRILFPQQIFF